MIKIRKPKLEDVANLAELGRNTFVQSHGHSASAEDVAHYLDTHYTIAALQKELSNAANIYHLLYYHEQLVGYSKIVFNQEISVQKEECLTKLERIYLLEKFHGLALGEELLNFNLEYAQKAGQFGMWLFTWKENKHALGFYEKMGFAVIGEHDFKISETHSNPNWQMLLLFD